MKKSLLIPSLFLVAIFQSLTAEISIHTFDKPFTFTYGEWENAIDVKDSRTHITNISSKGGAGSNVNLNLTSGAEFIPALLVRINEDNEARVLKLALRDANGRMAEWVFPLPSVPVDRMIILPQEGFTFSNPNVKRSNDEALNLMNISQIQIMGDWSERLMNVEVASLKALTPTETAGLRHDSKRLELLKPKQDIDLLNFDTPVLFSYGGWENKVQVDEGVAELSLANGKGGIGYNLNIDLSAVQDWSPVLKATISPENKAKQLRLMLQDNAEGSITINYSLEGLPRGEMITILPQHGASIDIPNKGRLNKPDNLAQIQIQGDWRAEPVNLILDEVLLVEPNEAILNARELHQADLKQKAEEAFEAKVNARKNIKRNEDSPRVANIYTVDRNILAVEIIEGELQASALQPYIPQSGDKIKMKGPMVEVIRGGKILKEEENRVLQREVNGKLKDVAYLAGGRTNADDLSVWFFETVKGDKLEKLTVDDVESYLVSRGNAPEHPAAVYRKSKPINRAFPNNEQVVRHIIYLQIPEPLIEGQNYKIAFPYLNTNEKSVSYTHDTRKVRSEAIHTSHIGYRTDDPYKRAFLSLWMGDKRAYTYENFTEFELINEAGETVYEGTIEKVLEVDGKELLRPEKNLSHTAVYAMDFSDFEQPGRFRIHVPGIGVSYPIDISEGTWSQAFKLAMHGFLSQRSGIELGAPFTTYERARNFHPDDGLVVYKSDKSVEEAYQEKNWFAELVSGLTDETVPGAWGGYSDAGDYDRASNHLWATYLHLELLDLFPDYFESFPLALPPHEAQDNLPDILNEALWNLSLFYRLQDQNSGGISGGLESSAHPRKGEDSPHDSLLLLAYAPDPISSYAYAATAARGARLLKKYDPELSSQYAASAIRAFEYAETNESLERGYMNLPVDDARNVSSVELLWLTGEDKYDTVFKETNKFGTAPHIIEAQGGGFTYARLPDNLGDSKLKAEITKHISKQANKALEYGNGNAFGLTIEIRDMPLIGPVGAFTVPNMNSRILTRAHYLTNDEKFLAGAIRAANFSAGANPDNMTFTTGVGFKSPIAPLHFDSRFTGQQPPAGLVMYGAYEHESLPKFTQGNDWVHTWMLSETMYPGSRTWPSTESYVDFFLWPMMNELTINQSMGPTSYHWGYLAARESKKTESKRKEG